MCWGIAKLYYMWHSTRGNKLSQNTNCEQNDICNDEEPKILGVKHGQSSHKHEHPQFGAAHETNSRSDISPMIKVILIQPVSCMSPFPTGRCSPERGSRSRRSAQARVKRETRMVHVRRAPKCHETKPNWRSMHEVLGVIHV